VVQKEMAKLDKQLKFLVEQFSLKKKRWQGRVTATAAAMTYPFVWMTD